jgi:hypothetical protein
MSPSIPDVCRWTSLQHGLFSVGVLAAVAIGWLAASQADWVHLRAVGRVIGSMRSQSEVKPSGSGVRLRAMAWSSVGIAICLLAGAVAVWHGVTLWGCRTAAVSPTTQVRNALLDALPAIMAFGFVWIRMSSAVSAFRRSAGEK